METAAEYEQRTAAWFAKNTKLWGRLLDCLDEEWLTIARRCVKNDGKQVWNAIKTHYGSATTASHIKLLTDLFDMQQGKADIETHVTAWRKAIPALAEQDMVFLPTMEAFLFLRKEAS